MRHLSAAFAVATIAASLPLAAQTPRLGYPATQAGT